MVNLAKENERKRAWLPCQNASAPPKSFICPSCWEEFGLGQVCWIAEKVKGDSHFHDKYEGTRFFPKHFRKSNDRIYAIDEEGGLCERLACPHCHLEFPPRYLETKPFTVSIVGATDTGKSFYLLALQDRLSKELGKYNLLYTDSQTHNNKQLKERCRKLFSGEGADREGRRQYVPTSGDFGGTDKGDFVAEILKEVKGKPGKREPYTYPKPFIYFLSPSDQSLARSLCLYDHAGERFMEEGMKDPNAPVTGHLRKSDAIFFVFDPTQIDVFIEDANLNPRGDQSQKNVYNNSMDIFEGMTKYSIKGHYDGTFVVLVTKCDEWMAKGRTTSKFWKDIWNDPRWLSKEAETALRPVGNTSSPGPLSRDNKLLLNILWEISDLVEQYITELYPQFTNAVKLFCARGGKQLDVIYVPVSATGVSPRKIGGENGFYVEELNPQWVEVPFLYALAKHGLMAVKKDVNF